MKRDDGKRPEFVEPAGATAGLRRLLAWTIAAAGALALAGVVAGGFVWARAEVSTVGEHSFDQELKVPPLLEPRVDGAGRKVFHLELQAGSTELLPGKKSDTWGANGSYLGPTLRASRGDEVRLKVDNRLPETTTLHWHGMHLPPRADGGPHQTIEPGASWSPSWRIDQPAASLWYHPHLDGRTAEHVYRGVAGMFILDDPKADELPLPSDYGVDDIPLIVQDKRFADDGSLDLSSSPISPTGSSARTSSSTAPTTPTSRSATAASAFASSTPRTHASTTSASPTIGPSSSSLPTAACSTPRTR